jgi:hypothetical protein
MVFQGGPQQLVNLFEKLHVHLLPSIFSQPSLAMHSTIQQAINTELYIFIHMSTSQLASQKADCAQDTTGRLSSL